MLKKGCRWLPRVQKPKYSTEDKEARVASGKEDLDMSTAELTRAVAMSMDGVVLTLPPEDATARENYVKVGYTHVYRKPGEGPLPELSGGDAYGKQVPYKRQVPMWGVPAICSRSGQGSVFW